MKEKVFEIIKSCEGKIQNLQEEDYKFILSVCQESIQKIREISKKYYCYNWYNSWGSEYNENSVLDGILRIDFDKIVFHFHTDTKDGYEGQGHIEMPLVWLDDQYAPYYENNLRWMRIDRLRAEIAKRKKEIAELSEDLRQMENSLN